MQGQATGKMDGTFDVEISRCVPFMLEDTLRGEIALADVIRVQRIPENETTIVWNRNSPPPNDRQALVMHTLTCIAASDRQEAAFRELVKAVKTDAE